MSLDDETSPSNAFDTYQSKLQEAAVSATKSAVGLPRDLSFYRSLDRKFGKRLDACSARILSLTARLLEYAEGVEEKNKGKRRMETEEDFVDGFHLNVVDTTDKLLERTDICLDEFLGRNRPAAIAVNPQHQSQTKSTKVPRGRLDPALAYAPHLPKPQLLFHTLVDNFTLWRPQLKKKPHALISLKESLSHGTKHPYQHEISCFVPPPTYFSNPPLPVPSQPFTDAEPITYVDRPEQLRALLATLKEAEEIAIDLEHHSYRSFAGFVCLMQLSTRTHDWIVDCLNPDIREELECLNEVFADPKIVKVLHGAESDIVWLQQDFNLYIVNLFDTYHATKVLDFPKHSLAALLEMYCDFTPDKRFQLADWRIRPLPEQMMSYARADTHFLLFIYDNLRQALTPAALSEVLRRSAETSLRTYSQAQHDAGGWESLGRRWNRNLAGVAGSVFRAVVAWRENVARAQDESTGYVLPNRYIFQLAEKRPADVAALFAIFEGVPTVVRARSEELLVVIREAVQNAAEDQEAPSDMEEIPNAPPSGELFSLRVAGRGDTGLWNILRPIATERSLPSATTSSALLGMVSSSSVMPYAASTSALFGSDVPVRRTSDDRYRSISARIHASLFIAPMLHLRSSQPQPSSETPSVATPPQVQTSDSVVRSDMRDNSSTRTEDHQATSDRDGEEIVVVGRPKKRKRRDVPPSGSIATNVKTIPLPEFDYSTAPDILDERSPVTSAVSKKKKRKEKGGGVQYGDFGAPPRNRSEVKSGNQAMTFR